MKSEAFKSVQLVPKHSAHISQPIRQRRKAWVSYYRVLRDDIQCATRLELRVRYKRSPNRGIYKCHIVRTKQLTSVIYS